MLCHRTNFEIQKLSIKEIEPSFEVVLIEHCFNIETNF